MKQAAITNWKKKASTDALSLLQLNDECDGKVKEALLTDSEPGGGGGFPFFFCLDSLLWLFAVVSISAGSGRHPTPTLAAAGHSTWVI